MHSIHTHFLTVAFVALVTFGGTAASAQPATEPPSFGPDTLWRWSWVGDPRISPDGRSAVFDRITVDVAGDRYSSDVWWVDLESGEQRQLTSHPANDSGARWSPDGKRLVFVSDRSDTAQLYLLNLESGGEATQLTTFDKGAAAPAWSPDGHWIAYLSSQPHPDEQVVLDDRDDTERAEREAPRRDLLGAGAELETAPEEFATERLLFRRDGVPGYLPEARPQLWIVDVATRVSTRKTKGPWAAGPPRFTADGRHVVFEADRREGADRTFHEADVYRVTLESPDGPERLTDAAGPQGNPLPSPDGRSIAAVGYPVDGKPPSHQDDGLWLLPNDGSALRQLTHGYDRAIGDGAGQDVAPPRGAGQRIRWAPDGKSLIATSARDGAVDLVRVGLDNSVTPLVTLDEGAIHGFDVATAPGGGERLVVLASFPTRPLELYTVDLPTTAVDSTVAAVEHPASWTRLTHTHDATDDRFVDYEELWIDSFDGQRVQGWLAKPASFDPAKRYPLVLYIHGGPHTMYGSVFFHEFQVLAHAGYAVLFTNPRGSTGYGTDFANIIQYRYPGDDYRDLMAFVDTVLERDWVDPERLGVAGGSGGGLLTTWTVGHTDRFAAAVAQRNVTNWHSFVGTSDFNHAFVEAWFPGYPWEVRDNYLERSPLYHVDKVTTPVLLIHSEQDYRTPLEQTLQYYVALKMRQLDAKLVIFPEEPHGLSRTGRPSHRIARLQHILDWFDRYLKP